MNQMLEDLKQKGVHVESALNRFLGKEEMYIKFIMRFSQDDNFQKLKECMASPDFTNKEHIENIERFAHTLKGVAANLGMEEISGCCQDILVCVRNGVFEDLKEHMNCLEQKYNKVIHAL